MWGLYAVPIDLKNSFLNLWLCHICLFVVLGYDDSIYTPSISRPYSNAYAMQYHLKIVITIKLTKPQTDRPLEPSEEPPLLVIKWQRGNQIWS